MASQKVRDVMTPNPKAVTANESLLEVARIMRDRDTGVVPVVEGKKVIGLVTDRDIVVRALADGKDCKVIRVSDVMTKGVYTVKEDASVDDVLKIMAKDEIRRVPVVNSNGELSGIVSMGDVSRKTGKDDEIGKVVQDLSKAPPNN